MNDNVKASWAMNAWEVAAIIQNRKTQHRIPIIPQPVSAKRGSPWCNVEDLSIDPPYGTCGQKLWVKEPFHIDALNMREARKKVEDAIPDPTIVYYRADTLIDSLPKEAGWKWRAPSRMPRWASRFSLQITLVSIEQLLDITDTGINNEGYRLSDPEPWPDTRFARAWNKKYSNQQLGWDDNPWVYVYTFIKL